MYRTKSESQKNIYSPQVQKLALRKAKICSTQKLKSKKMKTSLYV